MGKKIKLTDKGWLICKVCNKEIDVKKTGYNYTGGKVVCINCWRDLEEEVSE